MYYNNYTNGIHEHLHMIFMLLKATVTMYICTFLHMYLLYNAYT